ncbi:MAG: hypothetical protein V4598_06490 [Bdellovibrionota bacterium]
MNIKPWLWIKENSHCPFAIGMTFVSSERLSLAQRARQNNAQENLEILQSGIFQEAYRESGSKLELNLKSLSESSHFIESVLLGRLSPEGAIGAFPYSVMVKFVSYFSDWMDALDCPIKRLLIRDYGHAYSVITDKEISSILAMAGRIKILPGEITALPRNPTFHYFDRTNEELVSIAADLNSTFKKITEIMHQHRGLICVGLALNLNTE